MPLEHSPYCYTWKAALAEILEHNSTWRFATVCNCYCLNVCIEYTLFSYTQFALQRNGPQPGLLTKYQCMLLINCAVLSNSHAGFDKSVGWHTKQTWRALSNGMLIRATRVEFVLVATKQKDQVASQFPLSFLSWNLCDLMCYLLSLSYSEPGSDHPVPLSWWTTFSGVYQSFHWTQHLFGEI